MRLSGDRTRVGLIDRPLAVHIGSREQPAALTGLRQIRVRCWLAEPTGPLRRVRSVTGYRLTVVAKWVVYSGP